ncbi:MAG: hypothetical protein U0457_02815 [Candidatus Sericytochromatia bacterium]
MEKLLAKYFPDEGIKELLNGSNFIPDVPSGGNITTKNLQQEALLRLSINKASLDVSQYFGKLPSYQYEELIEWDTLREKIKALVNLENNETLVIRNDRVIDTIKTSTEHPRAVFINNEYKYFENFENSYYNSYEKLTRNNITYSGLNEVFEEQYKIFDNIANNHFNGFLDGKLTVTAGFGVRGTAQAFAINEKGGVALVTDLNSRLIEKRVEDGFCHRIFYDAESAIDYAIDMKKNGFKKTIGVVGNASDTLSEIINRGIVPNIITDATPAHEPLSYFPTGYRFQDVFRIKKIDPDYYIKISNHSIMHYAKLMHDLQKRGSLVFEYGDAIKTTAYNKGLDSALALGNIDNIIKEVLLNNQKVILKWFPISNDKEDLFLIDDLINLDFYDNSDLQRVSNTYTKYIFNKNLPSRKVIIDKDKLNIFLKKVNELIRNDEISFPILFTISYFDNFSLDNYFFKDGFFDINYFIEKIDLYKNTDFVNLSYIGTPEKYHKLEQKSIILDGSDNIFAKLNIL